MSYTGDSNVCAVYELMWSLYVMIDVQFQRTGFPGEAKGKKDNVRRGLAEQQYVAILHVHDSLLIPRCQILPNKFRQRPLYFLFSGLGILVFLSFFL